MMFCVRLAQEEKKMTVLLGRTGHLKSVDFITYKFQLLIVLLSQDLISIDIFESEHQITE